MRSVGLLTLVVASAGELFPGVDFEQENAVDFFEDNLQTSLGRAEYLKRTIH